MSKAPSLREKLSILADAAKYDASCASSGGTRRDSRDGKGIGSSTGNGICHSYTPDGRCVSLLKILLTNFCVYDCAYCINRKSSNVRRARFTEQEVVDLTLAFYRRNYIEGLFLSSGIIQSADYTMERLVRVARLLREGHQFRGYIHLKTIPEASPALIEEAGRLADRLSINLELPTEDGLRRFAPEKDGATIESAMGRMSGAITAAAAEPRGPRFAPAGQSTQVIVGADGSDDATILGRSAGLYGTHRLKRVYYSAFSPIPESSQALPSRAPPLAREHRLYQADWLMRYYGFGSGEILAGAADGMLDLAIDPKLAWALRHRERFPVDVNHAEREMLLRIPGLGVRSVDRLIAARRHRSLRLADLARLAGSERRLRPFVVTADHRPTALLDRADLRSIVAPPRQLALFA
ncbi:MAG: putative DNA modification/repair radical SAM protein [Rhodospirillales bacterium]|nr:putative DNA modification/repair radical SAM protein [Rhodospirillales bacterium]